MVEQRAAVEDRSRLLSLLLTLGGGVVLWLTLMTGTAHADQAPAPEHAGVSALLGRAPSGTLTHLTHATRATRHAVAHHVAHVTAATRTSSPTREVVRTATGDHVVAPVVAPVVDPVVDAVRDVRTQADLAVHQTTDDLDPAVHAVAGASTDAPAISALTALTRGHQPQVRAHHVARQLPAAATMSSAGGARQATDGDAAVVSHRLPASPRDTSRHTDTPAVPAPTDPGSDLSPGSGPVSGETAQGLHAPTPPASGGHHADAAAALPLAPAYPPGCSPD